MRPFIRHRGRPGQTELRFGLGRGATEVLGDLGFHAREKEWAQGTEARIGVAQLGQYRWMAEASARG